MPRRPSTRASVALHAMMFLGLGACDRPGRAPERGDAEPVQQTLAPKTVEPDARDPAGAVALLAALCDHAKRGDHGWVAARVQLPLQGIQSLNDVDEDPLLMQSESAAVEEFQFTRFCLMLPEPGTALRDYQQTSTTASGIVDFGKVPHRIVFDLAHDEPRLTTVDAQVPPRPMPPKPPGKVRSYELGAPPRGFTDDEPPGSAKLRRKVIAALQADPRCLEDYVSRDVAAVRFEVVVHEAPDGKRHVTVEPFQLVRASLLSCLRTQLPAVPELAALEPTRAIVELLVPVSMDELSDAPTLQAAERAPEP